MSQVRRTARGTYHTKVSSAAVYGGSRMTIIKFKVAEREREYLELVSLTQIDEGHMCTGIYDLSSVRIINTGL